MSLVQRVVTLIADSGTLSTFELVQILGDVPRARIVKAVQNASHLGYVRCIGLTERRGKAQGAGIWAVAQKPSEHVRPPSSVWDYAQR